MRILHILDHSLPLHSGYSFRTRALLSEQRKLGWETYHLTSAKQGGADIEEEQIEGWRFFRTRAPRGPWSRLPVLNQLAIVNSLARRLDEVVTQVQPDILHAHSPALNGAAALRVARRRGLPLVYEVRAFWEDAAVDHGTNREWDLRYRATRALETYVLKRADAITTICSGLRDEIITRGIPASAVTVIPNAVDVEQFALSPAPATAVKQRLHLLNNRVLGFIGSFYAYEGLALLLEALPLILEHMPDVRVLLVGGGPQDDALKQLARQTGVAASVTFTGRVPHAEVGHYYDAIDILVYPRLSMRLTELVTPLKPLEAMAQGRLMVASDVGGHRELIRDGETGVLFKAGDAASLAAKVRELLSHPERWPGLKSTARRFVETERQWEHSVARYRPVYGKLLGRSL